MSKSWFKPSSLIRGACDRLYLHSSNEIWVLLNSLELCKSMVIVCTTQQSSRDVHVHILHRERLIPHGKIWLMIAATFPLLWQIPYLTHLLPCWQAYLFECSKKKNWSMKQSSLTCKECSAVVQYIIYIVVQMVFFSKKAKKFNLTVYF